MDKMVSLARSGSLVLALLVGGCSSTTPSTEEHPAANEAESGGLAKIEADVVSAIDTAVNPCDDFYQYACGGWIANTELPSDQSIWGRGFNEIWQRNQDVLREIVEVEAPKVEGDAALTQLGDFYSACMNEEAIEAQGTTVLNPWLEKIATVQDGKSLMAVLAELHVAYTDGLFGIYVSAGLKNPDIYDISVLQSGLGLPDRDYYLVEDERMAGLRTGYIAHMTEIFTILGDDGEVAAKKAQAVFDFEKQLAALAMPRVALRNPEIRDNPMTVDEMGAKTPNIDWNTYFEASGIPVPEKINVITEDYLVGVSDILGAADYELLQTYLTWQLVHANATSLNKAIDESNFAFFGQQLQGRQVQRDRWKRCISTVSWNLGDSLAKSFVDREFAGDSKAISGAMIKGIEDAFQANLPELTWMDDATRERAVEKMHAISNKIGYPDTWRDYSAIEVSADSHFANVVNARSHESHRLMNRIGKAVDKSEWHMPSFIVNAYYNPSANEIVFPAGILQAPFFDRDFPAAMNFGAIGVVMGHELTHGFDDSGRKFDGSGELVEWWAPEVSARFEEAAQCVVDQYASYTVHGEANLNGELTLGENIADMGGVKQAYYAYKAYTAANGGLKDGLGGYTEDQLFFLAFAQSWCSIATPEIELMRVRTDSHSPPNFRVNGSLSNFRAFGEAFQCEVGTPMQPENICEVW